MGKVLLTAAAALACAGLAACNGNGAGGGSSGICKPFTAPTTPNAPSASAAATAQPGVVPAAPAADSSAALDDCLHRWGYALAPSSDAANIVAQATVAACTQALAGWNQSAMTSGGIQAPSLVTGENTTPIAEHHNFAEGRALFYVVQARAGHCAGPPVSNGTLK